jgi:hypothetical protein
LPKFDASTYGKLIGMNSHVYLKNTISGVVEEYDAKTAERYLMIYPEILLRVDSKKNEVLSPPYNVDSGVRRLVEPVVDIAPVTFQPVAKAEETKPRRKKDN